MAASWNRAGHYIFALWFPFSFFLGIFSTVKDWMSTTLIHIVWPSCKFRTQVWKCAAHGRWKYRMQKWPQKSPSAHHLATSSGCIFATKACIDNRKKNLLNNNMSSTSLHNVVNFGPLTADICLGVWENPTNFNGFHVLSSLLQRRRSTEANQTLHNVWPSFGLLHYCPLTEFCPMQNSLYIQVLCSPILAALLHRARHSSSGCQPNFAASYKEWNYGTFGECTTSIRKGGHHVGHRPTF